MSNQTAAVPVSVLTALPKVSTSAELWNCYMAVLNHNDLKPSDVIERSGAHGDLVRHAFADAFAHVDHYIRSRAFGPLLVAAGIVDIAPWGRAYARIETTLPYRPPFVRQQLRISATQGGQVNIYDVANGDLHVDEINARKSTVSIPAGSDSGIEGVSQSPHDPRARYYFQFLGQSLTQATVTFLLSMVVAAAGMAIVLVGATLAIVHANGSTSTLTPVLTSVAGLAVTTCGGVMARQANKARAHATKQAENIRRDMNTDQAFDRATTLISKVNDPTLRDRLIAITAVNELGLSPNPIDLSKHLSTAPLSGLPVESQEHLDSALRVQIPEKSR